MNEELVELEAEIQKQFLIELSLILKDIKQTVAKYIQKNVYDSYSPIRYERHYQLIPSLDEIVTFNEGMVYINPALLDYKSAMDSSRSISDLVPYYLNNGHSDGGKGMYHTYPKRHFLEDAVEEINLKYGSIICQILNN